MLQAGKLLRGEDDNDDNSPFEDYSIYMYRQQAPEFKYRVKELEQKLLHPVRLSNCVKRVRFVMKCCASSSSNAFLVLTLNNANQSQFVRFAKNTPNNMAFFIR